MKVCPDITVMCKISCQEQVALRGKENYLAMSEHPDQICLSLEFLVTNQKNGSAGMMSEFFSCKGCFFVWLLALNFTSKSLWSRPDWAPENCENCG